MADSVEKSEAARREEEILALWEEKGTFKQSLHTQAPRGDFVFYDGPPFATGLPHHGHILASTIKDAIPRYKTMRGYRVRRRWGWDCHGLPLENIIEKELNIRTKRDIEEMGVATFNEAARDAVLRYADEWKRIIPRIGRWVDMEDDYKTMDTPYTESVWWAFKKLNDDGLVEEGFKVMQLCPRCGTTLSNFEVSQGYKDIKDLTATVKFELEDEPGTYILAWTTTPWTLPGNVALAVGKDIEYARFTDAAGKAYFASKDFYTKHEGEYELVATLKGSELLGRAYKPLFSGVLDTLVQGKERDKMGAAFRVYSADFVATEEGTGIVHIAPAYGEEDLGLAREHGLPVVHHVDRDGRMESAVPEVAGRHAKPKGNWKETDKLIVEYLGEKVFKAEEKEHSYPHCWRCDTPLLNYASSSWFVSVPKIRDKIVAANKKIGWVPRAIGENRFGTWLENARDWAVSRSRYWGAPIPVWKNEATGAARFFGSIDELKRFAKHSGNRYFVMRHGEAEHNVQGIVSSGIDDPYALTDKGKAQVDARIKELKGKGITHIYTSPMVRTRETAERIANGLGLSKDAVIVEHDLRDIDFGDLNGKPFDSFLAYEKAHMPHYADPLPNGESYLDAKRRFGTFLYDCEKKHTNASILVVSHGIAVETLETVVEGADNERSKQIVDAITVAPAELRELSFTPLPHNGNFELDLHRPYIDEYELVDTDGARLVRVPDVFDCWFESGSMPYAQDHYPHSKDTFNPGGGLFEKAKGFPADFIAEGLDQTRGWFYSMLVLGVALFGKSPYKNVIVNGLILAEDGRKMSKSLKNYPEPMDVVERFGADALRLFLLSSPVMRAEDVRFSERGVQEMGTKVLGRLHNTLVFLETYAESAPTTATSTHLLDQWIMDRLATIATEVEEGLERYELDKAARPLGDLVDDLSTWYVRRSRERIKESPEAAATLRGVLRTAALLFAPFTPFYAEYLWQRVKTDSDPESVHLATWPTFGKTNTELLTGMEKVRAYASEALMLRQKAGLKVRQPLATLTIPDALPNELKELLADEVNVHEIKEGTEMQLDTELTPDLIREGDVREFARALADARKELGLSQKDMVRLWIDPRGEQTLKSASFSGVREVKFGGIPESAREAELSIGKIRFVIDAS